MTTSSDTFSIPGSSLVSRVDGKLERLVLVLIFTHEIQVNVNVYSHSHLVIMHEC